MATAPQINLPDGSGTTTDLNLTSNSFDFIFTGEVDSNVIDIQININGAGFVSNPSLIELSLPDFTIPNLSASPSGLTLEKGLNTIQLRAIDIAGNVSPVSTITVRIIPVNQFEQIFPAPTAIRMERYAEHVILSWNSLQNPEEDFIFSGINFNPTLIGYNIYASTESGGSGSGYLRVNRDTVSTDSPTKTTEEELPADIVSIEFEDPTSEANNLHDLVIDTNIVDDITNELVEPTSSNQIQLGIAPKYRININIVPIREIKLYEFRHNRDDGVGNGILNSDTFSVVSSEDPLYYVVTALYYDRANGQIQESRFSAEMSGAPLPLDTTIRGIRIREQDIVARDYIREVNEAQPTLSLIPGSTVREVHIEPFSNEAQKAYFLMDWIHRSKSFAAMLAIDDPNLTGTSIAVSSSNYKQNLRAALNLSSDAAVQALIDNSFDSLAQNFGEERQNRRPAKVTQTFYTTSPPSKDLIISQNAIVASSTNNIAPRFRARASSVFDSDNPQAYYNPISRRYEIKVQMVAEDPGAFGNVPANTLDTIVSGATGFQTVNEEAARFGRDKQSNLGLAEAASRVLSGLDTGTEGGYLRTALGTPEVLEARVVKSGDPDMMRDYDDIRGKHIGGKVDVWVKGITERTVSETFAFQFEVARNVRFDVIDAINLIFRARDSRLSENNPIAEMLYNPSQGFGLRNQSISPTEEYDLTGVSIIDYQTIALSTSIPQPTTLVDDFVEGDYRFRSNNKFISTYQPIRRITSVIGETSGALDTTDGFTLFKTEDPLLYGESTQASDYVEINQIDDIPSGDTVAVSNEQHVMVGQFEEPLNSVGINIFTIAVYNQDRTIQYKGPTDSDPDYLIVGGSQTEPVRLLRSTDTNIENGDTISVDYEKDENFVVTYVINDVLQHVQDLYSQMRHTTADVIVKQAIENPLLTEATVQLLANAEQSTTDSDIRTNVTVLTTNKGVGNSVRQSDMIAVIDNSKGVDFVVQPFSVFTLNDGALRIRDQLPSDYMALPALSQFSNAVFILTQSFPFDTTDGGGPDTLHHGVFMDELIMDMADSLGNVGFGLHKAWIIGKDGAVIEGYSDDATLEPEFITKSAIEAERLERTANKVVISLDAGVVPADIPTNHSFAVSYVVNGDRGVKDIETSQTEYITPGSLTITYRQA